MAVAITPVGVHGKDVHAVGDKYEVTADLTFTGSYATLGDALDPTPYFARTGEGVVEMFDVNGKAGYSFEYDFANKKLKVFTTAATELGAGAYPAGLTTGTLRCRIIGR